MAVRMIEHIEQTPGVCGGAPCIAGRRIRVSEIVGWHLHQKVSVADVSQRLDISIAQVYAALSYYYDHQAEIEQEFKQESELIAETRFTQGHSE